MKNLKRTLSLALAVVMMLSVFGMMTFASAKNYSDITDKEDITNTEAVSLLVDLGIIEGYSDGSFKPTQTITRGEMTKLITLLVAGNVDAGSFVGTTTDLTDINGHWAEGYIKYCYASGYVTGQGNGIFAPDAKITVVEAAKMLNVAIGYDATKQGYEYNSNWSVNIMRDASGSGILNNVSPTATASLDRDTAALMMYNALFANEVYYLEILNTVSRYSHTMGLAHYGLVKVEGTVKNYTSSSVTIDDETFSISGATYDAFLKTGILYAQYSTKAITGGNSFATSVEANKLVKVYSSELLVSDDNVVYYSADGDDQEDLVDDGYITLEDSVVYYVNKAVSKQSDWALGSLVEYIDSDGDRKVDFVKVTNYTGAEVTAYSSTSVTFGAPTSATAVSKANVIGYENIAKNDIVTVARVMEGLTPKYYVYPTEIVSGTVSRYSAVYGLEIDGNYYSPAEDDNTIGTINFSASDRGKTMTFYVDQHDYVYCASTSSSKANYAYVSAITSSKDLTGYYQAILYFADGTNKTVTVLLPASVNNSLTFQGQIVTYSVSNNVYTLTNANGVSIDSSFTFKQQQATIPIDGVSLAVTDNTVYVDTAKGKAYTGRTNIPNNTTVSSGIYLRTANSTEIAILFSGNTTSYNFDHTDYFIFTDDIIGSVADDDGNTVYLYNAIVDGERTTINVTGEIPDNFKAGLYTNIITTNANGSVVLSSINSDSRPLGSNSSFTALNSFPYKINTALTTSNIITMTDGTSFVLSTTGENTTGIYLYRQGRTNTSVITLSDIQSSDLIFVSDAYGLADYIIVYRPAA